jgi:hypothetical protein
MRVFINSNIVVNADNAADAERLAIDSATDRELSQEEITQIFGNYPHLAGPDNTEIDENGNITFTLPQEYTDLETWKGTFVRPQRDQSLTLTDKYMIPDYPISDSAREQWVTYRQALRDFPATLTVIIDPIPWPVSPVQE